MVRVMCGVQLKDRKRSKDMMLLIGLNPTMDLLAITSSVRLYCHALRWEDGHVLRMTLDFEVECQRKKGRPNRSWSEQIGEESVGLLVCGGKMHFADNSGVMALVNQIADVVR